MKARIVLSAIGDISERHIEEAAPGRNILNKRRTFNKKWIPVAAAVLTLSAASVFAMTGTFSQLMERLNPPFQTVLEPVEMACVDQGIKMEIVAAGFQGNMAMAYITLQDLEGRRIDERSYFGDGLFVNDTNGYCPSTIDFVDFDEANGAITYLCTAYTSDAFEYSSVTFDTSRIVYNERIWTDYPTGIDLKTIKKPETIDLPFRHMRGGGGDNSAPYPKATDSISILNPNGQIYLLPDNPASRIVNVGIIDQKLHVQTWRDVSALDSSSAYYLSDGTDDWIWPEAGYFFHCDAQGTVSDEKLETRYAEYEELIFPIVPNLSDLHLFASFNLSDVVYGEWSVTVENNQIAEPVKRAIHIETGDFTYESLSLNPFGLTLNGTRHNRYARLDPPEIVVHTDAGDVVLVWETAIFPEDSAMEAILKSPKPIDVSTVRSVAIDGTMILF